MIAPTGRVQRSRTCRGQRQTGSLSLVWAGSPAAAVPLVSLLHLCACALLAGSHAANDDAVESTFDTRTGICAGTHGLSTWPRHREKRALRQSGMPVKRVSCLPPSHPKGGCGPLEGQLTSVGAGGGARREPLTGKAWLPPCEAVCRRRKVSMKIAPHAHRAVPAVLEESEPAYRPVRP